MGSNRALWYFADPMCSWCWGFTPVISAITEAYEDRLRLALVLGGLRPGTTAPVTPAFREEILHHWQGVQRRTGQPFSFEGAMPEGFVYDTEPACRAVVVVADLKPDAGLPYFKSVQAAFYVEQRDVTSAETLAALAVEQGIDTAEFRERFESDSARQRTRFHFEQTYQAGIRGFPTVVLQNAAGFTLLTYGYAPLEELVPKIDHWLSDARA